MDEKIEIITDRTKWQQYQKDFKEFCQNRNVQYEHQISPDGREILLLKSFYLPDRNIDKVPNDLIAEMIINNK